MNSVTDPLNPIVKPTTISFYQQLNKALAKQDSTTEPELFQGMQDSTSALSRAFQFIEANYHQPISLSDVAKAVGYSSAYFTDLVRRETGQTVNQWILKRRLKEACCLLLETNQTVHHIAEALGYQNVGYFFRQFRQYYGTTPQSWRIKQRNPARI
jgi:AraC-like DNA-binding protein